jgi:hypothetical protein
VGAPFRWRSRSRGARQQSSDGQWSPGGGAGPGVIIKGSSAAQPQLVRQRTLFVGTWLSLVEHSLGVRGVGSSNLPVPTISLPVRECLHHDSVATAGREHPKVDAQQRSGCAQRNALRGGSCQARAVRQFKSARPDHLTSFLSENACITTLSRLPAASTPRSMRSSEADAHKETPSEGARARHELLGSSNLPVPTIYSKPLRLQIRQRRSRDPSPSASSGSGFRLRAPSRHTPRSRPQNGSSSNLPVPTISNQPVSGGAKRRPLHAVVTPLLTQAITC